MSWARRPRRLPGATTRAGLGAAHQKARKAALAAMPEGAPCWRCGKPMYHWQRLHYDHVIPRALGGHNGPRVLAHASCNVKAGARTGNQIRRARRQVMSLTVTRLRGTSRQW